MPTHLVTGVAGFIASRTAQLLLERGDSVVGVDDCNDYYDPRLKAYRLAQLKRFHNFTYHQGDIAEDPALDNLFVTHQFQSVLNLAARAGVRASLENPAIYLKTNTLGHGRILELMRHHKVNKIVLASTSSLYSNQPTPFTEDMVVDTPISPYAASKRAAELLSYTYHLQYGIDVSIVRYFTVYGPAGRPDMSVFRFIEQIRSGTPITIYGDGLQSRDFTYVDDIARGTIAAMSPVGYEVFNLGGGQRPSTLMDLIHAIETHLDRKATLHHLPAHSADLATTAASITKAHRLLNWQPITPLETGIAHTVTWHNQNRNLLDGLQF